MDDGAAEFPSQLSPGLLEFLDHIIHTQLQMHARLLFSDTEGRSSQRTPPDRDPAVLVILCLVVIGQLMRARLRGVG